MGDRPTKTTTSDLLLASCHNDEIQLDEFLGKQLLSLTFFPILTLDTYF